VCSVWGTLLVVLPLQQGWQQLRLLLLRRLQLLLGRQSVLVPQGCIFNASSSPLLLLPDKATGCTDPSGTDSIEPLLLLWLLLLQLLLLRIADLSTLLLSFLAAVVAAAAAAASSQQPFNPAGMLLLGLLLLLLLL
jgi:hypothetical protein